MTGEFDPRIMEACRIMYDRAPAGQIVSLVRAWVSNGDDPVANARHFVTASSVLPAAT